MDNMFLINNEIKKVGSIELYNDEILIKDEYSKYCFYFYIPPKWDEIKSLKVDEEKEIIFHEYVISENNIPALINPSISNVKRINKYEYYFYFKFDDFKDIVYMSKSSFDINLTNLEVKLLININDIK